MDPTKPPALNRNVGAVAPPPVPAVQAWAGRYDGRHGPLLDLAQAVPDTAPHPDLLAALSETAGDPATARYGAIEGEAPLRAAVAEEMSGLYRAPIAPDEVLITAGCNQAFFVAALTAAGPGETVLATLPNYFNQDTTLRMLGIATRYLPLDSANGFKPDPAALAAALRPEVRALVLVSPNNPTGAVYEPERLAAIYDLCSRAGVRLILDETYRDFLPPNEGPPHALFRTDGWRENVVSLYSFSKAFAVPGHRLGAMVGGAPFLAAAANVMDNLQICAPRPIQRAVAPLMAPLMPWRRANARHIAVRAAAFRSALDAAPGWKIGSIGAYFAYVAHPFEAVDATRVAEALAVEAGVLTLPGPFFGEGQAGFVRFAFANVDEAAIACLPERLAAVAPELANAAAARQ